MWFMSFPDVFPDDLPGMPLERVIEFVVELQPSTAPIAKVPYKMYHVELAELKVQLRICKTKVLFTQVHHLGAVLHCLFPRRIKIFFYAWIIDR
jgi:hypothetical protein